MGYDRREMRGFRSGHLLVLLPVTVLAACGADTPTEVMVYVDGQAATAAAATTIRVRVWNQDGAHSLDESRPLVGDDAVRWPLRVPLVPRGGDAARTFVVEAQLLDAAGVPVAWVRARSGYVAGELREILLCFEDDCRAEACGDTVTDCLAGPDAGPGRSCGSCRSGACGTADLEPLRPGAGPTRCPPAPCVASSTIESGCADRIDDDCDGEIDCADADCDGMTCGSADLVCSGGSCTCPPAAVESGAALCQNGADDDCDGDVDCADSGCEGQPCGAGGLACTGGTCACPSGVVENTLALCHNGVDDDCDGRVDCDEGTDCVFAEGPDGCSDGIDNDCNGETDCSQPSCCAAPSCADMICGAGPNLRCCAGRCVDTWSDSEHCGGCGIACVGTRICRRATDDVGGVAPGAGCRCATGMNDCPAGQQCNDLDGAIMCDCSDVGSTCPGATMCRRQGAMHHNYCTYP